MFLRILAAHVTPSHASSANKYRAAQHMGILSAHAPDKWEFPRIPDPRRHFDNWARFGGFSAGWSTHLERFHEEIWKRITRLHRCLTLWILVVFTVTSDEDILTIKLRTKQEKSPKQWSLTFNLRKFKMSIWDEICCSLVSRCWGFMGLNHWLYC